MSTFQIAILVTLTIGAVSGVFLAIGVLLIRKLLSQPQPPTVLNFAEIPSIPLRIDLPEKEPFADISAENRFQVFTIDKANPFSIYLVEDSIFHDRYCVLRHNDGQLVTLGRLSG